MSRLYGSRSGFTLIEILVTLLIFGIIGSVVTSTLVSLMRGASKTEIIKEVKQNGDFAMSIMESKVRNAFDITSACDADGEITSTLTITNPDSTITTFSCASNGGVNRLSSVTGGVISYLTNTSITITDCTTSNFSFTCTAPPGNNKNVKIIMTLSQKDPTGPVSETASQTFQTNVTLRN